MTWLLSNSIALNEDLHQPNRDDDGNDDDDDDDDDYYEHAEVNFYAEEIEVMNWADKVADERDDQPNNSYTKVMKTSGGKKIKIYYG